MNLEQMKIHMTDIVQEVSLKYKGGESYFNEIDERIKKDIYFLSFYFNDRLVFVHVLLCLFLIVICPDPVIAVHKT